MTEMSNGERYKVPQAEGKDVFYAAGEALANVLPFAGPELFRLMFASPWERRKNKWMEEVSRGLTDLCNKKFIDINELAQNEEFVTLAAETTRAALAQHEEEKLQSLKNALLNSLLQDISFDVKFSFVRAVEQLTPRHIHILQFAKQEYSPNPFKCYLHTKVINEIAAKYTEGTREIAEVFLDNLCQLKFIEKERVRDINNEEGGNFATIDHYVFNGWGDKFLKFISEPDLS